MPWPKGWTRKEVEALTKSERSALFRGEVIAKPDQAAAEPIVQIPEPVRSAEPQAPKAKPRNLFSGTTLKLQVFGKNGSDTDPIPGYRLYWFKDIEGGLRIQQAKASGWDFVKKEEIALNDGPVTEGNNDIGSNVRRWVGTAEDSKPLYSYLMKKPLELDQEHQQERERLHAQIEDALRMGTFNMTANERRYTAANPPVGSPSGLPPINISSKIAR